MNPPPEIKYLHSYTIEGDFLTKKKKFIFCTNIYTVVNSNNHPILVQIWGTVNKHLQWFPQFKNLSFTKF